MPDRSKGKEASAFADFADLEISFCEGEGRQTM